jgi:hypothetical protein
MSIFKLNARALQSLLMLLGIALAAATSHSSAADLAPPAGLSAPSQLKPIPAFNLQTVAGGILRSDDLRGKIVIVRFWATW